MTGQLHKANGVCEECYMAEQVGTPPPHIGGHCWTAADLLAYPLLRGVPGPGYGCPAHGAPIDPAEPCCSYGYLTTHPATTTEEPL